MTGPIDPKTHSLQEVYQDATSYHAGPPERSSGITGNELENLRTAYNRTSTGIAGFLDGRKSFLESLRGKNDSLVAALRDPNMSFGTFLNLRFTEIRRQESAAQAAAAQTSESGPRGDLMTFVNRVARDAQAAASEVPTTIRQHGADVSAHVSQALASDEGRALIERYGQPTVKREMDAAVRRAAVNR